MENTKKVKDYEKYKKIMSKYAIFFVLIAMIALMSFLSPSFLKSRNIMNIIRQISVIGLISYGVTLVIISKGIDLSSGSVLAVSAVVAASLVQNPDWAARMYPNLPVLPLFIPILIALSIGALAGFINGSFIAKTGIPPFIATLGMMTSARGFALLYADGRPISSLRDTYNFIGQGSFLGIPIPVLIFLIMGIVSHILLKHTKFGKYVYAIGGNKEAAFVSGVNVDKYIMIIYSYAGFLAALSGIVLSARISSGQPGLGVSYELDAIAAATIGGTSHSGGIGTIGGTIIGALIMGVLNNGLDLVNVSAYWQQIIKGAIIIGAVVFDMRKHNKKK